MLGRSLESSGSVVKVVVVDVVVLVVVDVVVLVVVGVVVSFIDCPVLIISLCSCVLSVGRCEVL